MQRLTWLSLRQLLYQMAKRPELLCGAIALSCTIVVILKFTCSRATDVIFPPPPPVRFFSARSPVIDLYLGQLEQADEIRLESEVSLLFFYAPWCGQSIMTRDEIEYVATKLSNQVLFVAVNCWWNQGKCRKQKNFVYYPVIHLYYRRFGPIEYKGPLTAAYIEVFVRRVMMPLCYIPSQRGLWNFLMHYEPGVIGYFEFNASPQPPGYLTFLTAALHTLKQDYLGTVRFGVITDKQIASEISLTQPGSMYLHRHFNTSLVFPSDKVNFTAQNVYRWVLENRETVLHWLRPHGGKSLLFHNELKKGAVLLMFLPFNPLEENHPLLDEITEVALQYSSCNKSRITLHQGDLSPPTPAELAEPFPLIMYPCCNTVILPKLHTISRTHNICDLCINQTVGVRPSKFNIPLCTFSEMLAALDAFYLKEHLFAKVITSSIKCNNFPTFYSPFSYYTACCKTLSKGLIGVHSGQTDLLHSSILFSSHVKDHAGDSYRHFPHIEGGTSPEMFFKNSSVWGLKCRTNKTLSFHLLDSNLHWEFAVQLGASRSSPVKNFAAIVDVKQEVQYIMDQNQVFTKPTLEAFIQNYSNVYSPLKRHLVSSFVSQSQPALLISEVTSSTFRSIVLDDEKNVLLLYYSQRCGTCGVLSHVFIHLARLLQPTKDFVVARINVDQNDLPWEFMVYRLPTILFFPQKRKDQSVKYPEEKAITLPNLLRFILEHYREPLLSASSCNSECVQEEAKLQQSRISQLEQEIERLRVEIYTLHQAQDQLDRKLSKVRQDKWQMKVENNVLRGQNAELQLQRERLQQLYEQKNKELEETANKLKELADVSENLLSENTLLRLVVTSIGERIKANQMKENNFPGAAGQVQSEKNEEDKPDVYEEVLSEISNPEPVNIPENTMENMTD